MIQQNNYLIFAQINIYNINIGKDKIEELNQNFENLTEIVKHNSYRDVKEIEQLIIKVKTILNMIINETKGTPRHELVSNNNYNLNYNNSYYNALLSALFFLEYLSNHVLDKINNDIFNEYNTYIQNLISELMPNINENHVKIYEWLAENGYLNNRYSFKIYSKSELDEFYATKHRDIIDFVINTDIHDFYPYYNEGGITSYLELSKKIIKTNKT